MKIVEHHPKLEPQNIATAWALIKRELRKLKKLQNEPIPHAKPFTSITSL